MLYIVLREARFSETFMKIDVMSFPDQLCRQKVRTFRRVLDKDTVLQTKDECQTLCSSAWGSFNIFFLIFFGSWCLL